MMSDAIDGMTDDEIVALRQIAAGEVLTDADRALLFDLSDRAAFPAGDFDAARERHDRRRAVVER